MQSKRKTKQNNYAEYERQKQDWINKNPSATPEQYTKAMREISRLCGV